jgi:hypothetical protein
MLHRYPFGGNHTYTVGFALRPVMMKISLYVGSAYPNHPVDMVPMRNSHVRFFFFDIFVSLHGDMHIYG